jgi:hypothetical protein
MMIRTLLALTSFALPSHGAETESEYRDLLCGGAGWQMEVAMPNGTRADCMTDRLAVEIDWAHKWAEAIGQSLNYAAVTGKQPAVILICKRGTERKCLNWLLLTSETASFWKLPITVWQCGAEAVTLDQCERRDYGAPVEIGEKP